MQRRAASIDAKRVQRIKHAKKTAGKVKPSPSPSPSGHVKAGSYIPKRASPPIDPNRATNGYFLFGDLAASAGYCGWIIHNDFNSVYASNTMECTVASVFYTIGSRYAGSGGSIEYHLAINT